MTTDFLFKICKKNKFTMVSNTDITLQEKDREETRVKS